MRFSIQVTPPGGWKFKQGNYLLISDTFKDLTEMVRQHRKSNNIDLGNVEKDIEDQLCDLHPSIITNRKLNAR